MSILSLFRRDLQRSPVQQTARSQSFRRLGMETLESKRMLSTLAVDDDGAQAASAAYSTIAAAVAAAHPGDTVKVYPGTYHESVTINKRLTLEGFSEASRFHLPGDPTRDTIVSPPVGAVATITLQADNIVVKGFSVLIADGGVGISTSSSHSGYVIRNNGIGAPVNDQVGISLNSNGASKTIVENNFIEGNDRYGILSDQGLRNATITHNHFEGNDQSAIQLVGSAARPLSKIIISGNTSDTDDRFVTIYGSSQCVITHNTILNTVGRAIEVEDGNIGLEISSNTITGGFQGGELNEGGIRISGLNKNLKISENVIRGSGGTGIEVYMNSLFNSTISGNRVLDCGGNGIQIGSGNTGNTINRNVLKGNFIDAVDESSGSGTAGTANFWIGNIGLTQNRPGLLAKRP